MSHTVSAMYAGIEIRAESGLCNAEEGFVETKQPSLTPCASAQRVNGQLDAGIPLQAKGAKWEPISSPAMPIKLVDEKDEHRHFIAASDVQFNVRVAEAVSKTQRKQISKAQAARDKEWDTLLLIATWDPTTVKEWSWVSHKSKTSGVKVHAAEISEICLVKGAELDD